VTVSRIRKHLRKLANPERARVSQRFFKTGPGEYGSGDKFIGNTVPDLRKLSKEYSDLPAKDLLEFLHSEIHEERVLALLILNEQFQGGTEAERKRIHRLFLKNIRWINNWDLVDCSAPLLVGEYLLDKESTILDELASSRNLWERRIAIVSTLTFIKRNRHEETVRIARLLLSDKEDLIHKATGWMLRELGKRNPEVLKLFLDQNALRMPRTMLRYAIERFPEAERQSYLTRR
jgi:3-methyladenine DNA glycosylase AlkD